MSSTDEQIATILAQHGVPADGSVCRVENQAFIQHRALERIAAQAKITFDPPTVLRSERDEAVLLVLGRMGKRVEWSIGGGAAHYSNPEFTLSSPARYVTSGHTSM